MPDGSGFLISYRPDVTDQSINIYRFDFASKRLTQLTHFDNAFVGDLSISPDGSHVVFDRTTVDPLSQPASPPTYNLWMMKIDGSGAALFVTNGRLPEWGAAAGTNH